MGGWAANIHATVKLSDLGNISFTASSVQPGFGSLDSKVNGRSMDQTNMYNVTTNLDLGKFFPPKLKIQIPMFASFGESVATPLYNPLDPDIYLTTSMQYLKTDSARKALLNESRCYFMPDISFTNVHPDHQTLKATSLGYFKFFLIVFV